MAKPKFLSLDGVRTLVQWAKDQLATKVDKVAGKDLSDNNYSDDDVAKLESIENGAQSNIIESISVNNVAQAIDDKNVNIAIPLVDDTLTNIGQSADAKATGDAIAEVNQSLSQTATAIRQEFDDADNQLAQEMTQALQELSGTIPTKTSELTNDSNYVTTDELTDGLATKEDTLQYGTATAEDVGKAMMPKTVANGKVTSWEFGEAGKVDDVQINGASVLSNKVANIPIAGDNSLGVVMVADGAHGLSRNVYGRLKISEATSNAIKSGNISYTPITPIKQHEATFYGLAKVAGHNEKDSELPVGQYTDEAKTAIQSMLGVDEFNFSDRIAKGVDNNGDVVAGAIKEGNISNNVASGDYSHAEGQGTIASGPVSHAEGYNTTASGAPSHAEGYNTVASGTNSHAEGYGGTFTINNVSYASEAKGMSDHTEGYQTRTAIGRPGNHAEGYQTAAIGGASHAEGNSTTASGNDSHAEGAGTIASGNDSHAEGAGTIASGTQSHAEGSNTTASGTQSHAEGFGAIASGAQSHAEGISTVANHKSQHVFGAYNIEDLSSEPATNRGTYVEIVGNGTANNARSNARTLDWSGNEVLAGKLTVGAAPTDTMDVSTKGYVDTAIADAVGDITSFEFQVVTELPATGTKGVIYLVAHTHGANDVYDEYIWITDKYERLGTLDVDLSDYATTQYVDDELATKVDDITVNGTSIVSNGVAEIPVASTDSLGVVKIKPSYGVGIINDFLMINSAVLNEVKLGGTSTKPISPYNQHNAVFYGLAKAAGYDEKDSTLEVGTYTDEAKSAIQTMLGVDVSISSAIDNLVNTRYHVCEPSEYNSNTYIPTLAGELGVIYLVPKPIGDTGISSDSITGTAQVGTATVATTNNIFYEYIYTGDKFEQIGDTKVDLTGYLTDADIATDASVTTMLDQVFL